jgi:hypothetical protein
MKWIVAIILAAAVAYEMSHDLAGCDSGVTLLQVWCDGKVVKNTCEGKLGHLLQRVSFSAFPDRQEVVTHSGSAVERLDGCVVQDRRTWTCTQHFPDGTIMTRAMNDGEFTHFSTDAPPSGYHTVFVSAWRYYWHRFTQPQAAR